MVEFKHQRQENRGIDRFLKLQAKVSFTKHYALILQSNLRLPFVITKHDIILKIVGQSFLRSEIRPCSRRHLLMIKFTSRAEL